LGKEKLRRPTLTKHGSINKGAAQKAGYPQGSAAGGKTGLKSYFSWRGRTRRRDMDSIKKKFRLYFGTKARGVQPRGKRKKRRKRVFKPLPRINRRTIVR